MRLDDSDDRAVKDGLVKRDPDPSSKSVVRVTVTQAGSEKLDELAEAHVQELAHLAPTMRTLWRALEQADGTTPHPAARPKRHLNSQTMHLNAMTRSDAVHGSDRAA